MPYKRKLLQGFSFLLGCFCVFFWISDFHSFLERKRREVNNIRPPHYSLDPGTPCPAGRELEHG